MKTYKIGVIGAGAIAQNAHIPGYAKAKNCELTAIADPLDRCLKEVKSKGYEFHNTYHDYREMLKRENLDVISICTPNYLHKEMAVAAFKKGCQVLLEKPIAINMVQAKAIRNAQVKYGTRCMVSFTHRFNLMNVKAKEALKKGDIGKPYMVRVRMAHTGPIPGWAKTDWFYDLEKAGGGAMLDMAIHAFDLIQWYLGPVTAVHGKAVTLRKKIKVDDNALAILEFGESCLGYVEAGWTSPAGFRGLEIMGDNGMILVDYSAGKTTITKGVSRPDNSNHQITDVLVDKPGPSAWVREMEYFTSHLNSRKPFDITVDDGISALNIALACYKSSLTGKTIKLKNMFSK